MQIPINVGGNNLKSVQLSVTDNVGTSGDEHGNIQVFDFGVGPFIGAQTLTLVFSGFYGEIYLGLRTVRDSNNDTAIFNLRSLILPVNNNNNINRLNQKQQDLINRK